MWLFGPVFVKELLEMSRRRRYFLLRILVVLVLLFIIATQASYGANPSKRELAEFGARVFRGWAYLQFWILVLATPIFVGGLIASERERGSLDLLFTTQLTNREIIFGKLASRLWVLWLVMLSSLPVLVLVGLMGGIEFDRLVKVVIITLTTVILVASISIYYSTTSSRTWVSTVQTVAFLFFFCGFLPYAIVLSHYVIVAIQGNAFPGMPSRESLYAMALLGPEFSLLFTVEPNRLAFVVNFEMLLLFTAIWLAAAWLFLLGAMRQLRMGPQTSAITLVWKRVRILVSNGLQALIGKRAADAASSSVASVVPRIPYLDRNPIIWRNRRSNAFDQDHIMYRITICACLVFGVSIFFMVMIDSRAIASSHAPIIVLEVMCLHAVVALAGASSIARERQRGSLDLLLISKLRPWEITLGNLHGIFSTATVLLLFIVSHMIWATYIEAFEPEFAITYLGLILSHTLLLGCATLAISIASTKVTTAMAFAVLCTFSIWLFSWPPILTYKNLIAQLCVVGSAGAAVVAIANSRSGRYRALNATVMSLTVPILILAPSAVARSFVSDVGRCYPTLLTWLTGVDHKRYCHGWSQGSTYHYRSERPLMTMADAQFVILGITLAALVVSLVAMWRFERWVGLKDK